MTIEDCIAMLRRSFPAFGKKEIYDVDARGNDFCEIVLPNVSKPRLPLTVTVTGKGCSVSVGHMANLAENVPAEQAPRVIADIVEGRVVLVFGYKNEGDRDNGKTFYTDIFALTGGEDDMSAEYEKFVLKISTPLRGLKRYATSLKGVFDICTFDGSIDMTVYR